MDNINHTFNKGLNKVKKQKQRSDTIKTTLNAKHQEIMKELSSQEESIPKLEGQISELKTEKNQLLEIGYRELTRDQITRLHEIDDEIAGLEREIRAIPQKKNQYFLKNGSLIFDYNEIESINSSSGTTKIKKISIKDVFSKKKIEIDDQVGNLKTKADCLRQFLSNVDPNYVYIKEHNINEDNFCENCQCFRVLKSNEAVMACPQCGSEISVIMESDKPSLKDPPPETRHYEYKRYNHFCDWLAKIQGKESSDVPDEVIADVEAEIKKERIKDKTELTEDTIRRYLKKYPHKKYDKYYNHITQILFKVNGVPPLSLTSEQEKQYKMMFLMIQEPYERHRPESRSNFSSYSYILYKFSQLLGYKYVCDSLRLLKSREKIYQLDAIWKKICRDLGGKEKGWIFMPS